MTVWVFIHLVGVLGFLAAHGASTAVAVRIRHEPDPARLRALLDLSRSTRRVNDISLVLLLGGGIAAGIQGGLWGRAWLDVSLALFVGLAVIGVPVLVRHFRRLRRALRTGNEAELRALAESNLPIVFAVAGAAVLLVILWLMVAKPS